jgi:hypothetical protein
LSHTAIKALFLSDVFDEPRKPLIKYKGLNYQSGNILRILANNRYMQQLSDNICRTQVYYIHEQLIQNHNTFWFQYTSEIKNISDCS